MKHTTGVLVFVIALSFAAVVHAQKPRMGISGSRMDINEKTGAVTLLDANLLVSDDTYIDAGKAVFIVSGDADPTSVDLSESVVVHQGVGLATAKSAIYYPELKSLTADSLITRNVGSNPRLLAASAGTTTWTCSSGTLYRNGTSTGGSSACWGSNEVSCTGDGGNRVNLRVASTNCS
jgi:hypothetical protein